MWLWGQTGNKVSPRMLSGNPCTLFVMHTQLKCNRRHDTYASLLCLQCGDNTIAETQVDRQVSASYTRKMYKYRWWIYAYLLCVFVVSTHMVYVNTRYTFIKYPYTFCCFMYYLCLSVLSLNPSSQDILSPCSSTPISVVDGRYP